MTPEQIEDLEHLIDDPDWNTGQRERAWKLLLDIRDELAALRSPAPAATVTDALIKAGIELHNALDDNSIGHEWLCENWRKALAEYEKSLAAVRGRESR